MNLATKYPLSLFCFIFCFLAACSFKNRVVTSPPVVLNLSETSSASKIKIIPIPVTLAAPAASNSTQQPKQSQKSEIDLIKDGVLPPYDTVLKRNFILQKAYFRVVDTSRNRKIVNDSLKSYINDVKNLVLAIQDSAKIWHAAYIKTSQATEQNKQYTTSINWQFYLAAFIFLTFQILIYFQGRTNQKKLNRL